MKTGSGGSSRVGPLRSPMGSPMKGLIKKSSLRPAIADNTCRSDIETGAAKVRSAQTAGKIIKPF